MKLETRAMAKIQLAKNSVGHACRGHNNIGGLGVDLREDRTRINLAGTLADVDEQLIEIRGSDDGGSVRFELQLQLGDLQRDGLVVVSRSGWQEKQNRQQRQQKT